MLNADEEHEWYYFGLPVSDLRYLLRAVLLCADADENVFLDLTEIEGDYFMDGDEPYGPSMREDPSPHRRPLGHENPIEEPHRPVPAPGGPVLVSRL
jgi:hypothetical protein